MRRALQILHFQSSSNAFFVLFHFLSCFLRLPPFPQDLPGYAARLHIWDLVRNTPCFPTRYCSCFPGMQPSLQDIQSQVALCVWGFLNHTPTQRSPHVLFPYITELPACSQTAAVLLSVGVTLSVKCKYKVWQPCIDKCRLMFMFNVGFCN